MVGPVKKLSLLLGGYAAGVVGLFVYMHTGDRVQDACTTHGMNAAGGGLSLSPLGTRCSGGLPPCEGTYVAQDFVLLAGAMGMLALAAASAMVIRAHQQRAKLPRGTSDGADPAAGGDGRSSA